MAFEKFEKWVMGHVTCTLRSKYYFVHTSPQNAISLEFTDGKYAELLRAYFIVCM